MAMREKKAGWVRDGKPFLRRLGRLALVGAALAGCSRIQVTRTINADGTLVDDIRFEFSEKGVGDNADMSGMRMDSDFGRILKETQTGRTLVGDSVMKYKGDAAYTATAENAAQSGILYESGKWLTAQKAVWVKLPDGGFRYELPIDVQTLPPAFYQGGLGGGGRYLPSPAQPVVEPEPDPSGEPPPDPIFKPETPPNTAPNPQNNAKIQAMLKEDEARLARAWKNLEVQVDLVMPGKIATANAKSFKDRTATWIIKVSEFLPDPAKVKEGNPPLAPFVLKATCGAPVPAAKADEERYRKLAAPPAEPK